MSRQPRLAPPLGDARTHPIVLTALALFLALLAPACRRQPALPALPAQPAPPASADPMPEWYPATLPADQYLGAAACGGCHQKQYQAWQQSPHGHAMAVATPDTVLGEFAGREVRFPGGTMTPSRVGDSFFITVGQQKERVELVLGSGRQHQIYLMRDTDGSLQLFPAYWATKTHEWVLTTIHLGTSLDPSAQQYWRRADALSTKGCLHCHLSQGRTRTDGKTVETRWGDLSINCESCHGPGRAHVEARAAKQKDPYADLTLLSKEQEGQLCARCHAAQPLTWDASRPVQHSTIAYFGFRPDATQFGTPYQYGGHLSSLCYQRGALTCTACHDPHRQTPRSLSGESAEGPRADLQCTVCHRDLAAAAAKTPHSHHAASVRCIDCHMPLHWLTDSADSRQRVADHAISIPRPQESIDQSVPNACTECHRDKDPVWALGALRGWRQTKALGVRPWVRAFSMAKLHDPRAKQALIEVLGDPASSPFWRASAVEMLGMLPPDPALVKRLEPLAADPDPILRIRALTALLTHDEKRRESWLLRIAADDDPLVRADLMFYPDVLPLSDGQYRKFALDMARRSIQPPGTIFANMAASAAKGGQPLRALMLLELARPHSTPRQAQYTRQVFADLCKTTPPSGAFRALCDQAK